MSLLVQGCTVMYFCTVIRHPLCCTVLLITVLHRYKALALKADAQSNKTHGNIHSYKVSRSMDEPLSQAMEDDQEIIIEDIITENIIPAEDRERRQDGNSENTTSLGAHTTVTTPDKREQLASQAEEEIPSYSGIEELRKHVTEGKETTTPCSSGNCEEDNTGQILGKKSLLKSTLPAELEKKTADLKQDRSNARSHNMNQCSNTTTDDVSDLEEYSYDKELPCSFGQCSSAENTNAEIEEFERRTRNLRKSNSELEDRVKSLQSQVKDLVKTYHNFQGGIPQKATKDITHGTIELHEEPQG